MDTLEDPGAPDPARALDVGDMKDRIADAIARLPEREKLVIALYYYENLTLREIGEVLRRDRVARLPAAHQGGAAPALADAGRLLRLTGREHPGARRARAYVDLSPREGETHAHSGGSDSQRRPRRPSRRREDLAARGAAVRGRGDRAGWGAVVDGNTVSDADPDEQARQMSISTALSSFEWAERKINLLDTPGEPSFVADALGALRVCESAVFVVNAVMGVEVSTARLWARAAELDIARMLFVNMLDRERADFFRTLEQLKAAFGPHVVATEIPIGSEQELSGRDRPRRHARLPPDGLGSRPPAAAAAVAAAGRRSRSPTSTPRRRRSTARS